jgi:hypothetical protein
MSSSDRARRVLPSRPASEPLSDSQAPCPPDGQTRGGLRRRRLSGGAHGALTLGYADWFVTVRRRNP